MTQNRAKTEPGQYKCKVCGKTFKTEDELKEHNRRMHPEPQTDRQPESEGSTVDQRRS